MKLKWRILPVFLLLFILAFDMKPVHAEIASTEDFNEKDKVTNEYIFARKFIVDGKLAICIEGTEIAPVKGDVTSEWTEVHNENLRKVIYYGYGGPKDQGYSFVQTSCAAQEANGDNDYDLGVRILAEIVKLESPPTGFRIWKMETRNGLRQDLVVYTTESKGYISLKKISADETITNGNPEYSLAGAVYGIYSDKECDHKVGEIITDANGESTSVLLEEGTYYVKEITAPPGYQLDETCHEVKVLVERTVTITVEDLPKVQETFVLPETGSGALLFLEIVGFEFILLSLKKRR